MSLNGDAHCRKGCDRTCAEGDNQGNDANLHGLNNNISCIELGQKEDSEGEKAMQNGIGQVAVEESSLCSFPTSYFDR